MQSRRGIMAQTNRKEHIHGSSTSKSPPDRGRLYLCPLPGRHNPYCHTAGCEASGGLAGQRSLPAGFQCSGQGSGQSNRIFICTAGRPRRPLSGHEYPGQGGSDGQRHRGILRPGGSGDHQPPWRRPLSLRGGGSGYHRSRRSPDCHSQKAVFHAPALRDRPLYRCKGIHHGFHGALRCIHCDLRRHGAQG